MLFSLREEMHLVLATKFMSDCFLFGMHDNDGTNLEFHSYQISSKFWIEYEHSVASNSIKILNAIKLSCWDLHDGIIPYTRLQNKLI